MKKQQKLRPAALLAALLFFSVAQSGAQLSHSTDSPAFTVDLRDMLWQSASEDGGDWFDRAWFGHFFDAGEGWIYHAEHGWWYVADRDTANLFVYDTALATWGWTSKAGYPWIYWFYPRNVWTFYGRGGQPGERRFFSAMAGEWREEGALSEGGFIQAHDMILVEGGVLSSSNDLDGTELASFHIGRFEVTWGEWKEVQEWGEKNGYYWPYAAQFFSGVEPSGCAENHPVHSVNWIDVIKWCNARSEMEGLTPVYKYPGRVIRSGPSVGNTDGVIQNPRANGYRLPSEAEWEFAARGGNQSNGYTYAGSDDVNEIAWYRDNSGGAECDLTSGPGHLPPGLGIWPVGQKAPNELGLHDMTGNVSEWCWDILYTEFKGHRFSSRGVRGGSFSRSAEESAVSQRSYADPIARLNHLGFRLARSPAP